MFLMKQNIEHSPCNPREIFAVFFSAVASAMAFIYWLIRLGLNDNSPWIFVHVLPLAYFVFLLPIFIKDAQSSVKYEKNESCFTDYSFLIIINLTIIVLAGFVAPYLPFNVEFIFITVGILLFSWYGIHVLRFFKWWKFIFAWVFFIAFSLWIANAVWGSSFDNPLFLELMSSGYVQRDTLFHSTVVSMIKTYDIPSTGLNGAPYLAYHFGSHWIFAQLSKLTSLEPVQLYQLVYPLIFIPLFFYSLLLFVAELKELYDEKVDDWDLLSNYGFWITFFIIIVGFMSTSVSAYTHIKNMVTSESYCMSLTLSFLTGSVLLKTARHYLFQFKKNFWTFWTLTTLLVLLITFTKVSTGFLFLFIIGYLFIRLGLYKFPKYVIGSAGSAFLVVFALVVPLSGILKWDLLTHLVNGSLLRGVVSQESVEAIAVSYFYNLILSIAYVFYRIWEIRTLNASKNANQGRYKYIDLEIIFVLLAASVFALTLMDSGNGLYSYFTDIQKWFALALVLSIFTRVKFNFIYYLR